jgi:ferredoxin-NADP reductase
MKHIIIPLALTFDSKKEVAPNVFEFRFKPKTNSGWKAGQHILLFIPGLKGKNRFRGFSVSSPPNDKYVTITTRIDKNNISEFKKALIALKKGSALKARGPLGPVHTQHKAQSYTLLASGIGITPFRAIIKDISQTEDSNTRINLFYVGDKDNHIYKEELQSISANNPNINMKFIYKPERITGQLLEETLGQELHNTLFLLSGSSKIVKNYKRTLVGLGVKKSRIKHDTFLGYHPKLKKTS